MATTLSGLVKKTAEALFHYAGGTSFLRRRFDSGVRILMYHRFRQTFRFETQCTHLKKRYHPVTLTDVAGWLRDGKPIPQRAVAVTVDDGYRDFLETAFPVPRRDGAGRGARVRPLELRRDLERADRHPQGHLRPRLSLPRQDRQRRG